MTPLPPPAPQPDPELLDLTPAPEPSGSPHPSPSAATPAGAKRLNPSSSPRRAVSVNAHGRRSRKIFWLLAAAAVLFVGVAGAAVFFLLPQFSGMFASSRPDLLPHTVQAEYLPVTVVERGTLESTDNRDVTCRVKAGSRGTFASTIKWVIDDGTTVTKGQPLMELDDSSLKDQEQAQGILVSKANSAWVKAKEELAIQLKMNDSDKAQKFAALKVAELDFEKFLGVRQDDVLNPIGSLAGSPFTLVEKGEYRMKYDDVSGRLKLAESDLEAYRDRSSWAERSVKLGYLTPSQAKVERSKLESANDSLGKLTAEKYALENFTRMRELTDLSSKVDVAKAGYEQAILQARAKLIQMESEVETTFSVLRQELDKMAEIKDQLGACKIVAPQTGMVVYYKENSGRFGNSNEGLIAVGAQVKEGQKMLRIPDLNRMQVSVKVHEALVSRIKGDDRKPTGAFVASRIGLVGQPHLLSRITGQSDALLAAVAEVGHDHEYYVAGKGMRAYVRIDAFPDRLYIGRVRTVAAVAAMGDWMSSDVKLYQTIVQITGVKREMSAGEDEDNFEHDFDRARIALAGLRPDMSAEVTIQVDPAEQKVLTVPIQAVVGGAESGPKRKILVMENGQPVERDITLGMFNDKKVEVKEGLKEGDIVVLNPKVIIGDKARTREDGDPSGRGAGKGKAAAGGDKSKAGGAPGAGQTPKKK